MCVCVCSCVYCYKMPVIFHTTHWAKKLLSVLSWSYAVAKCCIYSILISLLFFINASFFFCWLACLFLLCVATFSFVSFRWETWREKGSTTTPKMVKIVKTVQKTHKHFRIYSIINIWMYVSVYFCMQVYIWMWMRGASKCHMPHAIHTVLAKIQLCTYICMHVRMFVATCLYAFTFNTRMNKFTNTHLYVYTPTTKLHNIFI